MKFSDEELSRILSAHAKGEMRRGGWDKESTPKCCVIQAAYGVNADMYDPNDGNSPPDLEKAMVDFDAEYNAGWPMGKFVRWLERAGLA